MANSLRICLFSLALVSVVLSAKVRQPRRLCDLNGVWKAPLNSFTPGCSPGTGGTTGVPCNPGGTPNYATNMSAPFYHLSFVGDRVSGLYSSGLYALSAEGKPGPNMLGSGVAFPSTTAGCSSENGCWDLLVTLPYTSTTIVLSADCKNFELHPLGNASAPILFPGYVKVQ